MNSKIEVLSDGLLENVTGGESGKTDHTYTVNDQNYHAFIRSAVNVVILFGVSWSGTCESACDIIEKLTADNRNTRVGIFEVTNNKLGIKSVLTTIRYKGGTEIQRIEGTGHITRLF
ncbi:MAG: thioredoxin family protein [Erysipelotrichaceae bacterium]|nr:thioredoxin family protein [Erysipelotrichaceae bacterium]